MARFDSARRGPAAGEFRRFAGFYLRTRRAGTCPATARYSFIGLRRNAHATRCVSAGGVGHRGACDCGCSDFERRGFAKRHPRARHSEHRQCGCVCWCSSARASAGDFCGALATDPVFVVSDDPDSCNVADRAAGKHDHTAGEYHHSSSEHPDSSGKYDHPAGEHHHAAREYDDESNCTRLSRRGHDQRQAGLFCPARLGKSGVRTAGYGAGRSARGRDDHAAQKAGIIPKVDQAQPNSRLPLR